MECECRLRENMETTLTNHRALEPQKRFAPIGIRSSAYRGSACGIPRRKGEGPCCGKPADTDQLQCSYLQNNNLVSQEESAFIPIWRGNYDGLHAGIGHRVEKHRLDAR